MAHIDLHCHSNASDGALPPAQVIERAVAHGAQMLALTDHECLAGLAEARAAAEARQLPFIDGVEVSVTWRDKHTIHIVGLGIDPTDPALIDHLSQVRQGRRERLQQMSELLAAKGIAGVYEGALALAANPDMVGRAHIARYLVSQGVCKDVRSVFRQYIVPGKPGYVKHEWAQLDDAVAWILNAGGAAVIAHPGRYEFKRTTMSALLTEFKQAGGEAIEVAGASHSLDERLLFARYAAEFDLLASAGSDFHVPDEKGREVGITPELPPICQPLWTRWLAET